ncbi:MAG: hypothetical protein LAT83_02750 [Kiritimatiellae bacterium]|nr:hypothetical protein [Kiritimatiellia bacterium]
MSGNSVRIKRKSSVLQPRGVQVVYTKTNEIEQADPPPRLEEPPVQRKVIVSKPNGDVKSKVVRRSTAQSVTVKRHTTRLKRPSAEAPATAVPAPAQREPAPPPSEPAAAPIEPPPEIKVKQKSRPSMEVLGEPTFKFFCYRCGQKLQVPVSWANKSHTCGRCGHDIVIPPPLIGEFW